MYRILSLKWSSDDVVIWWRGNNAGYTRYLEDAGLYTQDDIDRAPAYYNDGESTIAVPVDALAEMRPRTIVELSIGAIDIAKRVAPTMASRKVAS